MDNACEKLSNVLFLSYGNVCVYIVSGRDWMMMAYSSPTSREKMHLTTHEKINKPSLSCIACRIAHTFANIVYMYPAAHENHVSYNYTAYFADKPRKRAAAEMIRTTDKKCIWCCEGSVARQAMTLNYWLQLKVGLNEHLCGWAYRDVVKRVNMRSLRSTKLYSIGSRENTTVFMWLVLNKKCLKYVFY